MSDLISNKDMIQKLERDSGFKTEVGEFTFNDIVKALKLLHKIRAQSSSLLNTEKILQKLLI